MLGVAVLCSLLLTYLTVTPPLIPGDWSRLNTVYLPPQVNYDWTPYVWQVGLWVGLVFLLASSHPYKQISRVGTPYMVSVQNRLADSVYAVPTIYTLTALTLLGFALRLHTWDSLPLIMDEIGFAAHASDILHGQHVPLLAPGHNGNPSLYSALVAFSMSCFGQNLLAIRLVSVFFGTLTIPAAYLLGRTWWSWRVGLVAAAILTVFPAHVFFSRLSLYNIAEPFFSILALTLLHRGIQKNDYASFTWSAIFAAIAQYFYHGSRLTLVLMAVYALFKFRRELLKPLIWLGWVWALLVLPLFASIAVHDLPLSGNSNTLRLPDDFERNVWRAWLAWVGQPDRSPFWLSDAPLMPALMMVAFVVGVLSSFRRDARHLVLLLSPMLTIIFGGIFLTAAPLYIRYMTALPAMVMLAAVVIGQLPRPYQIVIVCLICLQGVMVSYQHMGEARSRITYSQWQEADFARQAADLPAGYSVLLRLPPDFGPIQKITVADYIAVYGQRRPVGVVGTLPEPIVTLAFVQNDTTPVSRVE